MAKSVEKMDPMHQEWALAIGFALRDRQYRFSLPVFTSDQLLLEERPTTP